MNTNYELNNNRSIFISALYWFSISLVLTSLTIATLDITRIGGYEGDAQISIDKLIPVAITVAVFISVTSVLIFLWRFILTRRPLSRASRDLSRSARLGEMWKGIVREIFKRLVEVVGALSGIVISALIQPIISDFMCHLGSDLYCFR